MVTPTDLPPFIERIQHRYDKFVKWLREKHPNICEEQKHLDADSVEQAYWHYGYAVALKDILDQKPIFPADLPKMET